MEGEQQNKRGGSAQERKGKVRRDRIGEARAGACGQQRDGNIMGEYVRRKRWKGSTNGVSYATNS